MVARRNAGHNSSGFTLVELLVVIAIIGILIAMLVPAVQRVRESANRTRCENNLKQLCLALHNHHDAIRRFPPGGAVDQPPFGTRVGGAAYGSSWIVYILPYIEQHGIFDQLKFDGNSGWTHPGKNYLKYDQLAIASIRCPSSGLSQWRNYGSGMDVKVMRSSYAGVSGADSSILPTETRISSGSAITGCCSGGRASAGGILFPNAKIKVQKILDGSSNTIILAESSDFLTTVNGTKEEWSSGWHGFAIGASGAGVPPSYNNGGDARTFNQITVRYKINQSTGWPNAPGNCGAVGVCDNIGNNPPFTSAHPGGVNVAFADGSVRFLFSDTEVGLLARLATRDDGIE